MAVPSAPGPPGRWRQGPFCDQSAGRTGAYGRQAALINQCIGGGAGDRAGDRTYLITRGKHAHDRPRPARSITETSHVPPQPIQCDLAPMGADTSGATTRPAMCKGATPSRSFYGQRLPSAAGARHRAKGQLGANQERRVVCAKALQGQRQAGLGQGSAFSSGGGWQRIGLRFEALEGLKHDRCRQMPPKAPGTGVPSGRPIQTPMNIAPSTPMPRQSRAV